MQKLTAAIPLAAGCDAALQAQSIGYEFRPDGLYAADAQATQAQGIIDTYSGSAAELQYHQRQSVDALVAKYASIIAAGRLYSVVGGIDPSQHPYQIDEVPPFDPVTGTPTRRDSQSTMSTMATWATNIMTNVPGTSPWPTNFAWRDANNAMVPMTAAQCYGFTQNVGAYIAAAFGNYSALYMQIMGAATVAAVTAIDITAGWPSNP